LPVLRAARRVGVPEEEDVISDSCRECGAELRLRSAPCPLCGAETDSKPRRTVRSPVEDVDAYQKKLRLLRKELKQLREEAEVS
jgi:hypothetical protein